MQVGQLLGAGTFGVVYQAFDGGTPVALKKIKMERQSQGFPVTSIREMKILKIVKHPNIVQLLDVIAFFKTEQDNSEDKYSGKGISDGDVFMVFEYVDYDLYGLLKSPSVRLTTLHIKSYMQQLLRGVDHMVRSSVLHRDIKSANILVTRDNVIKIADWGLSKFYKDQARMTKEVCTLWYRAPELLMGTRNYGPEIDMWSVGCIFGEIVARQAILPGDTVLRQLELVQHLCGTPTGDLLKKYQAMIDWEQYQFTTVHSPKLRRRFESFDRMGVSLLERMLCMDPAERISADRALGDEFFLLEEVGGTKKLLEIPPPHILERFENVEFPREGDSKRKEEEIKKAKEAAKLKWEQEQAAAGAVGFAPKRKSSTNLNKYRVIGPEDDDEDAAGDSLGGANVNPLASQEFCVAVAIPLVPVSDTLEPKPM